MKKYILLLILFCISNVSFSQDIRNHLLDSVFTALYAKGSFNGNVLIAEKGNVIFEKSYGLANEETQQQLNIHTKFELASVSKQFTAMGILLLEKQGKLKYDDNISKYIPELSFYDSITIRHLIHHTGGLPDYMDLFEDKWDKTKFATNQDIVDEFAKHKPEPEFPANEKFEYSNTGYALLGLIIEKASGQTFEEYLKENIFSPLSMDNTFVYRSRYKPQIVENYAMGYVADSLGKKVLTDSFGKEFYTYYLDGIVGDGMVNSTLRDLLKWDRALYSHHFINDRDRELIFTPTKTKGGKKTSYGFGWAIKDTENYGKIVNHSGGWAGYYTFIERHLTNDKTIIVLQNNALITQKNPIKEVTSILYNEPLISEKKIEPSADDLTKYIGIYSSENFPLKISVFQRENALFAEATGQQAIPLDAYENHTFKFEPADIKMVFNVEENSFLLTQGGMSIAFKKE